jgi:hypothetical protein
VKIFLLGLGFLLTVILSFSPAIGQHAGHQMPAPSGEKKEGAPPGSEESPSRAFLLEGNIKASFSIMAMAEHKKMLKDMKMKVEVDLQATHNIVVTLTDTRSNLPIGDLVVKMKVIDPKGKEQVKLLDAIPAMNQYGQNFDLTEKGRYQVLILFRNGGKKTAAGFYYRLK